MSDATPALLLLSPINDARDHLRGLRVMWPAPQTEGAAAALHSLLVERSLAATFPKLTFWAPQADTALIQAAELGAVQGLSGTEPPDFGPSQSPKSNTTASTLLLKLLGQITSDAETRDIEDTLKRDPQLSVQLLRLVNSVSFSLREPVTSFAQAINILGRRQLQRWLQLLMFASQGSPGYGRPLMARAALRGALMEQTAKARHAAAEQADMAFMVGMFSLLDELFGKPLAEIVLPLKLGEDINAGLLDGTGPLAALLALAVAAEHRDLDAVQKSLSALGLTAADWNAAQCTALQWTMSIGHEE